MKNKDSINMANIYEAKKKFFLSNLLRFWNKQVGLCRIIKKMRQITNKFKNSDYYQQWKIVREWSNLRIVTDNSFIESSKTNQQLRLIHRFLKTLVTTHSKLHQQQTGWKHLQGFMLHLSTNFETRYLLSSCSNCSIDKKISIFTPVYAEGCI